MKNIRDLLSGKHDVKLTGAEILYLTNLIRDRNIMLLKAKEVAEAEGFEDSMIQKLKDSSEASTLIGCKFLDIISEIFGEEWLDDFLNGEAEIPEPPEPKTTLN